MATLLLAAVTAAAPAGATINAGVLFFYSVAAAYIDSTFIYPALFPPPEVKGPRLNDFEFQHAEEGAPANRLFGKKARVAGTVVWAGSLREIEDRDRSGKGGQGGDFVRYKYYRHVAVEIGRLKRGKVIKGVSKVLTDGRPFFDPTGIGTTTSNKIRVEAQAFSGFWNPLSGVPFNAIYSVKLVSDEAAGGPQLDQFQSGQLTSITGFTNTSHPLAVPTLHVHVETTGAHSAANGITESYAYVSVSGTGTLSVNDTIVFQGVGQTFTITQVVPSGVSLTDQNGAFRPTLDLYQSIPFTGTIPAPQFAHIRVSPALTANLTDGQNATPTSGAAANNGNWLCHTVGRSDTGESYMTLRNPANLSTTQTFCSRDLGIDTITIEQEDRTFPEGIAKDVRFYNGSRSQPQDPTIVAEEGPNVGGAANVPAFRGRAMMVIEDLELTDFGNRLPNFEFDVEIEDDPSLATTLGEMLQDARVPSSDYNLTRIPSSLQVGGYVMRGLQNSKAAFQPLLLSFHLLNQQTNKLEFFQRTAADLIDVTSKTVAAVPGEKSPRPGKFQEIGDIRAQQIAYIRYFDPDNDFQVGTKKAKAAVASSAQANEFDTNLVMTGDEAQRLVNTLYELGRTSGKRTVIVTLPPSLISTVRESVRLRLDKLGQDRTFLVLQADLGANFILQCQAVEDDLEAFTQTQVSEGTLA